MTTTAPGGTLTLADDLTLSRMGYGAMQLAGPGVFGPPKDRDEALAVLRTAVDLGITHIDTSDFYGPVVVNELIREALRPYPSDLRIVTKVGARRGGDGSWIPSLEPGDLKAQVHENLQPSAWRPWTSSTCASPPSRVRPTSRSSSSTECWPICGSRA
jgi:aryl-alcohol dehydrogenase-like predicted oxidoreductase